MLTPDGQTDDLRKYLKSLTEAVDSAVTNRDEAASGGGRRRWPIVVGAAAASLAVVGILALSGMDGRQAVSATNDGEVDMKDSSGTARPGLPAPGTPPPQEEAAPADEWGPLTVVGGRPSGRLARTTGTLTIDETCVTLTAPDGEPLLLIWPSEATVWDSSTQTVLYTSGGAEVRLSDGDTVSFGGGAVEGSAWLGSQVDYVAAPDPSCTPMKAWFVGSVE